MRSARRLRILLEALKPDPARPFKGKNRLPRYRPSPKPEVGSKLKEIPMKKTLLLFALLVSVSALAASLVAETVALAEGKKARQDQENGG